MTRKFFFLALALAALALVELLLSWRVALATDAGAVAPRLLMLMCVFVALHERPLTAAAFAWCAGAVADILYGAAAGLGPGILGMLTAAGCMMVVRRAVFSASTLMEIPFAFMAVAGGCIVLDLAEGLAAHTASGIVLRALYTGAYSAGAAPVLFAALRVLARRCAGSERGPLSEWSRQCRMHAAPRHLRAG